MGALISIAARGLDQAPAKFYAFREAIKERKPTMLDQIGIDIEGRAREDYLSGPRPDKLGRISGDLARSVAHRVDGDSVEVGSNLPYAAVHEGALGDPFVIFPKHSKFLVFKTLDGEWHSVKSVTIHARPYLKPSLDGSRKDDGPNGMRGIVTKQIEEAKKEAGLNG